MWKRCLAIFLGLWLSLVRSEAAEFTVVSDEWEGFTEAGGHGYYFEMMKAVYEPAGHTLHFKVVPYMRALKMIQNGKADLIAAIDFADLPPAFVENRMAVGMDGKDAFVRPGELITLSRSEDLRGLRVVARRGYAFDQFLPSGTHYEEITSLAGMLKMLEARRADVILDYEEDMRQSALDANLNINFDVRPHVLKSPLFMGFSTTAAGNHAREVFMDRFARLIDDLEKSSPAARKGVLADLAKKHGIHDSDTPRHWDKTANGNAPAIRPAPRADKGATPPP